MSQPIITVIVPVHNGSATLQACLAALNRARDSESELLVVDDRSTDGSAAIAREAGAIVLPNAHRPGPAGARNQGAEQAAGELLLFVDADVVVPENAVALIRNTFVTYPELSALFGSYDAAPSAPNFLSQYKNLFHHYIHQRAQVDSSSFWAGCGAIRADAFRRLGGFNENEYPYASIEDIELGWRLARSGGRTRLEKSLQVKHLKKWTALSLLKADILRRAIPWTRLLARSSRVPNDLNLRTSQRISALLGWGLATGILQLAMLPWLAILPRSVSIALAAGCAAGILALNVPFYRFFLRLRGPVFTAEVFFWHIFYFLYSSATFAGCWIYYSIHRPAA